MNVDISRGLMPVRIHNESSNIYIFLPVRNNSSTPDEVLEVMAYAGGFGILLGAN
jgi:hypothetical protein